MREVEVPLRHAVPFLLRARGYEVTKVARLAGYNSDSGFFFCLYSTTPSEHARRVVSDILGIDPWDFYDYKPIRIKGAPDRKHVQETS